MRLQAQLMELKTSKYEAMEREDSLKRALQALKNGTSIGELEKTNEKLRADLRWKDEQYRLLGDEKAVVESKLAVAQVEMEDMTAKLSQCRNIKKSKGGEEKDIEDREKRGKGKGDQGDEGGEGREEVGERDDRDEREGQSVGIDEVLKLVEEEKALRNRAEEELQEVKSKWQQCKEELDVSQSDRTVILTSMADKDLKIDELQDRIVSLQASVERERSGTKKTAIEVQEKMKEKDKQIANLRTTLTKLRKDARGADAQQGQAKELELAHVKISQLQEALTVASSRLAETDKAVGQLREERDSLKKRYDSDMQIVSESAQVAEKQLTQRLKETKDEYVVKLSDVEQRYSEELKKSKENFGIEMSKTKNLSDERIRALEEELHTLRGEKRKNEDLTQIVRNTDEEVAELKKRLVEMETELGTVRTEAERRMGEWTAKEKELLETASADRQKHSEELLAAVAELEERNESAEHRFEALVTSLTEEKEKAQEELVVTQNELQDLKMKQKVNDKRNRSLVKELQQQIQKEKAAKESMEDRLKRSAVRTPPSTADGKERVV